MCSRTFRVLDHKMLKNGVLIDCSILVLYHICLGSRAKSREKVLNLRKSRSAGFPPKPRVVAQFPAWGLASFPVHQGI